MRVQGVLLDDGHPLRGLFIIDPKGTLRFLSHNGASPCDELRV